RFSRDWSSDVCSSDLFVSLYQMLDVLLNSRVLIAVNCDWPAVYDLLKLVNNISRYINCSYCAVLAGVSVCSVGVVYQSRYRFVRSEERRVGKVWRCRW